MEKQITHFLSLISHYVWIFFEYQYILYKKGKGCEFYERGKRYAKMLLDTWSDSDFVGHKRKNRQQYYGNYMSVKHSRFFKISWECY